MKKKVLEKLKEVIDPEVGVNVVDLGLIYGVEVKGDTIVIKMSFTTPSCPLLGFLVNQVQEKAKELKEVKEVKVELVWDPPWSPERISEEGKRVMGL
ncbi:metal-sulfur cluster assembly factor [Candidatus Micrarchaeota archaeon]|nr:metal-sulfur cluster assembly factor [Candidatus Micrarchaeota archaeon]